jgi:hypothetical protein
MKPLKTLRCPLLTASLFAICSCTGRGYISKGAEKPGPEVTITDCVPDPDLVRVDIKKDPTVYWTVKDTQHTYRIDFVGSPPIPDAPVRVSASAHDKAHKVSPTWDCSLLGGTSNACKYKYTITQDNSNEPCKDPGLHVIP